MKRATSRRRRGRGARRLPARAVRGLGGRPAGRRLPAGHVDVHGHGARPDRPRGRLLRRDGRDDHARPDPAGRTPARTSRARASATTSSSVTTPAQAIVESTVGHDIVAGGTDSGADVIGRRSGTTSSRRGEELGLRRQRVDDRARHAAARPRRRDAHGADDDRPRLLRVEAADGADGPDAAGHARRAR